MGQANHAQAGDSVLTDAPDGEVHVPPEPPQEPMRAPGSTPAKEIRLELAGGDGRVEVKLSDQGGELKIAVRTPDSHLAERLRDHLPTLSSRLAEAGVHSETWHPSAAGAAWQEARHVTTASHGDQTDTPPERRGQEQGREGQPRRQNPTTEFEQPKEKGKDFEWFLSAMQ
jgi:Flagellar hook-length control protein FliK